MMVNRIQQFLTILVLPFVSSDVISNGLTGDPVVECGSESLTVRFATEAPFEGHSYVKGHYISRKCRTDATLDYGVNITVPYAECDVIRQRSNNPKGLLISSTIIISFHPMFVTKVDKSYKVQCFYAEMVKTVTQQLEVSVGKNMEKSLLVVVGNNEGKDPNDPRNQLRDDHGGNPNDEDTIEIRQPLPECKYQVLTETKEGEPVKFATVGQQVYHQWTCETSDQKEESAFCATVHSCNVREEGGKEVQLLDENGCAVDRYLLNNLEYTSDLTGGQISQVFKFADQPSLFFQCQIRLSLKEDGKCKRSSDACPIAVRGKRSTEKSDNEVDVISQKMTVFDIDDPVSSTAAKGLADSKKWNHSEMCVSPVAAGSLLALLASTALVSLIAIGLLCCRPHTVKVNFAG